MKLRGGGRAFLQPDWRVCALVTKPVGKFDNLQKFQGFAKGPVYYI